MKKKETAYKQFRNELVTRYDALVEDYNAKIDKARAGLKNKAHFKFFNTVRDQFLAIQMKLGKNSRLIVEIEGEMEDDKDKKFDKLFDLKISSLEFAKKDIVLKDLSQMKALDKIFGYLTKKGRKYKTAPSDQPGNLTTTINWKGVVELEFIQLIYALHETGYLINDENEITTLVKQVANAFNLRLGKHWQSNLSDNVNNRNEDYQPKVFEKLAKGFATYREKQIEINKEKKPK